MKCDSISNFLCLLVFTSTIFSALGLIVSIMFDCRVVNAEVSADSGMHCCFIAVWGDFAVSSAMFSSDLKGCLSSLIPLLTSHPSLSPPLRKAETKAPASGSAELPPEYLTSPLSQQSQVIQWTVFVLFTYILISQMMWAVSVSTICGKTSCVLNAVTHLEAV